MFKPFAILTSSLNQILNGVFDLKVTLRFPRESLENLKGFISHLVKKNVKLI